MENAYKVWEEFKSFYVNKFGIEPSLVDIASVLDVLRMCASGASNKSISSFMEISEDDVAQIVDSYLGFVGWKDNLPFNPLRYYKDWGNPSVERFVNEMVCMFGPHYSTDLRKMYDIVSTVERLERLIYEKWV